MKGRIFFCKLFLSLLFFLFSIHGFSQSSDEPTIVAGKDTTRIANILQVGDSLRGVTLTPAGRLSVRDSSGYYRYEFKPVQVASFDVSGSVDSTGAMQIVTDSSLSRIGLVFRKGLLMEDSLGKVVNMLGYDTSYLKTLVELGNGIKMNLDSDRKFGLLPGEGIVFSGAGGDIDVQIHPDSSRFTGRTDHEGGLRVPMNNGGLIDIFPEDGITMYDPEGSIITRFNQEGSYHTRLERHPGGLEVPYSNGGRLELLPDNGMTMRDPDGIMGIRILTDSSRFAGRTDHEGGLRVPMTNGGRIDLGPDNGMTMWDPDGDIDIRILPDSSLFRNRTDHEGGIRVPLNTGGRLELLPGGGIIFSDSFFDVYAEIDTEGNVTAADIVADNITASEKNFRIDHPLDPVNKYLYHTSMESSERLNLYNGNTVLDANGEAIIPLPDWFEALNENYRYQLTPIGASAPNLFISKEVENNQFSIAGGTAGLKISWQISGTRRDKYARTVPKRLEEYKPLSERGG